MRIDMKQIGEGGFPKVYSATWIDGQSVGRKYVDGSWEDWKKLVPKPMEVALKYLNLVYFYIILFYLSFYLFLY